MYRPKMTLTRAELRERAQAWVQREFDALPLGVVECYAECEGEGTLAEHVAHEEPGEAARRWFDDVVCGDVHVSRDEDGDIDGVMLSEDEPADGWEVLDPADHDDIDWADVFDAHEDEIREWGDPDIIWGTIFATGLCLDPDMIRRHGMVPIEGWGDLPNTMIGFSGGGYDFYSEHWIPLYLDWLRESWDVEIIEEEA